MRVCLRNRRVILAVSGGIDSMALLHAAGASVPEWIAAVACFDHGTGDFARNAVDFVGAEARRRGLPFVTGRTSVPLRTEESWRVARWGFLRRQARLLRTESGEEPAIVTAHNFDDHIETVLMRVLRGSGARGLAGLQAETGVLRPLHEHSRRALSRWVLMRGVQYMEDPSNSSRSFLRNRVRLDLLPALERVDPGLSQLLLRTSIDAAQLRSEIEQIVSRIRTREGARGSCIVDLHLLSGLDADSIATLAPALAARAGIRLDRRGTARLAAFLASPRHRGSIQLSGGYEVEVIGRSARFRLVKPGHAARAALLSTGLAGDTALTWNGWRFRCVRGFADDSPWGARIARPHGAITVRSWSAGDRMTTAGSGEAAGTARRRVKRFLSDAGVAGADRRGWPVVLDGDDIAWIPGVRRGIRANCSTEQDHLAITCERVDA